MHVNNSSRSYKFIFAVKNDTFSSFENFSRVSFQTWYDVIHFKHLLQNPFYIRKVLFVSWSTVVIARVIKKAN